MRDDDIQRMYHTATQWPAAQADPKEAKLWTGPPSRRCLPARSPCPGGCAAGSASAPVGLDQDRDIAARVELAAGGLDADADQHQAISFHNKQP